MVLLGLRVDPGHRHIEGDHVVEQRVVGQDPELLEHRNPVLAREPLGLLLGHGQRGARGTQGTPVVVAGSRARLDADELGQRLLDRRPAVREPLDGRHPALRRVVQVRSKSARVRLPVDRGRPAAQAAGRRPGQPVEAAEEPVQVTRRTIFGEADQLAEEGARVGRAERAARPPGVRPVLLAGEAVDEVGDVLSAQDLLGGQVRRGRADLPVDDRQGILKPGQLIAAAGDEGEVERAARKAPGPADPLQVGRDRLGQRREQDSGQVADVDAHLQRRRRDKYVRRARVAGRLLELALVLQPGDVIDQAGVLPRDDPPHVRRRVQATVVVVRPRLAAQPPRAAHEHAGRPVELADDRGGARLLGTADGAGEQVPLAEHVHQGSRADDDRARRDGEHGAAALGRDRVQDVRAGEALKQLPRQARPVACGDAEGPLGPAGVPGLRAADRIEERVLDPGRRADPREGGRGAAPGKRGHSLAARAAAPDVVPVPVMADEALEPLMLRSRHASWTAQPYPDDTAMTP